MRREIGLRGGFNKESDEGRGGKTKSPIEVINPDNGCFALTLAQLLRHSPLRLDSERVSPEVEMNAKTYRA